MWWSQSSSVTHTQSRAGATSPSVHAHTPLLTTSLQNNSIRGNVGAMWSSKGKYPTRFLNFTAGYTFSEHLQYNQHNSSIWWPAALVSSQTQYSQVIHAVVVLVEVLQETGRGGGGARDDACSWMGALNVCSSLTFERWTFCSYTLTLPLLRETPLL